MKKYDNGYILIELFFSILLISIISISYFELISNQKKLLIRSQDRLEQLNLLTYVFETDHTDFIKEQKDKEQIIIQENDELSLVARQISPEIYKVEGRLKSYKDISLETYVWIK